MARGGEELYVGVDVGGTKIAAALVRGDGGILTRTRLRTPVGGTGKETLAIIMQAVENVLPADPEDGVNAVGIGVPGILDTPGGRVLFAPNLDLDGLRVTRPVEKRFGVPTVLGNDVDLGTLGETWLGAARGAASAVGIFVGTGIGGGIVSEGRILHGSRSAAGEIGHVVMQVDGPPCNCGGRGCFEALAGRWAIERDIRAGVAAGRKCRLADALAANKKHIRSKALRKALKAGDPLVTEVIHRAAEVIGHACVNMRHLLDPEVIVLGGGVLEACAKYVMPVVEEVLAADPLPVPGEGGRVAVSELGDDACLLGAVALARAAV